MERRVETDAGVIAGVDDGQIRRFLGIPYGAPPVGPGRFAPPRPATPWTGVREALEFGPAAHQPPSPLVGEGLVSSEDCLSLNVWAPSSAERLPVMVWFHGGSFTTGASLIPWYDGEHLATRGVVVVTVNYRLGPLGFLHLEGIGGEAWRGSANAGLLDQVLALDWVQRNIAAFGGDPSNVTIFGESAGAMSVSVQMALPAAQGRFHRAIAQSGAASHVHEPAEGEAVALAVLDALGVSARSLDRLRELPPEAFTDVQAEVTARLRDAAALPFRPTIDGSTLPGRPLAALAPVPLLTGTTSEEMRLFTALARLAGGGRALDEPRLVRRVERFVERSGRPLEARELVDVYRDGLGADADPDDVFVAIATDVVFRLPAIEMVEAHGGDAWMYLFTHRSSAFDGLLGAAHAVEIPFAFDNLDRRGTRFLIGEVTDARRELATRMADAWTAFAATGDPTTPSLGPWPRYEPATRSTMLLDTACSVVDDPHGDERRAWRR